MENEINGLLAGQFNTADFEELEKELREICGEAEGNAGAVSSNTISIASTLPETPSVPILPEAPKEKVSVDQARHAFSKSQQERHAERA